MFNKFNVLEKLNDKISEKKETISRSNKWKLIISEISRKKIILGCKGETFLDKINTFFNNWSNYYIIRRCCSYDILLEYHYSSSLLDNECKNIFKIKDIPDEISKFLNINNKDEDLNIGFLSFNIDNKNNDTVNAENNNHIKTLSCDIEIDKLSEFYSYFNYQTKLQCRYDKGRILLNDLRIIILKNEKHESSNITQHYVYCNNEKIYKGWVSIIRIQNFSSQPVYYNNLIKRYAKEIKVIINKWLLIESNNNFECSFDTKMNKLLIYDRKKLNLNETKYILPFSIREINEKDILFKNKYKIPWALKESMKKIKRAHNNESKYNSILLPKNFK